MKARVGLSGTDFSPKPYKITRPFHYVYAHRPQHGLVNCNLGTGSLMIIIPIIAFVELEV
jgi:hypothetical protein